MDALFNFQLANSEWALAYFILEWILRLALIALVLPSRPPAAARNWLLLGFLMPVPAVIAYALFGRVRNPPRRSARERQAVAARKDWLASHCATTAEATPLRLFVSRIGGNPLTTGNAIELLCDYDATVDALVAAIDDACQRVRLVTYIFADDATGRRIIAALARARSRGVTIEVMFDAFGSRRWRKAVFALLREARIPARACNLYNPLTGGTGRLDRRNHRKIYVIDDRIAFMGSQNFVGQDFRKGIANHELVMRIEGPLAAQLGAQVVADWIADGGPNTAWPGAPSASPVGQVSGQLLSTGPEQREPAYSLLLSQLLQEARPSVLVVAPYMVFDEGLQLAVRTAAMRGVEVTMLVSAVADHPLVHLAQEAGYAPLLDVGVTIRRFGPGLLHAKYVLVDGGRAVIGSSNADIRSFQINSEISLVSEDPALVDGLAAIARGHLAQSQPVSPEQWAQRPLRRRTLQRIAALASPLL